MGNVLRQMVQMGLALALITGTVVSCGKKPLSKDEARKSVQEMSAFMSLADSADASTSSDMLKRAQDLVATTRLSKLAKENLINTLRQEVELEIRINAVVGNLERDKWYLDDVAMRSAVKALPGWRAFAGERIAEERRLFRAYVDEISELLPPQGAAGARSAMDKALPLYDDYEEALVDECWAMTQAVTNVYTFLINNKATMSDTPSGPFWDSPQVSGEFVTLTSVIGQRGQAFLARMESFGTKRAELMKLAQDSVQKALSELSN